MNPDSSVGRAMDSNARGPRFYLVWGGPGAETSTFHPAAEWTDVTAQVSHVPRVQ